MQDTIENTIMCRFFKVLIILIFTSTTSMAGSDGQNELSKETNGEVKDCFETVNRGIFAFNQLLDNIIVEPLAKGYRYLPSPIKTSTSNALNNLSLVVTIPNNLLQGEISLAGKNTGRFLVNSTIGILGLFDPASKIGLNDYEKEDWRSDVRGILGSAPLDVVYDPVGGKYAEPSLRSLGPGGRFLVVGYARVVSHYL